ncbi:pectin lyase fold/virulence factor [Clohesyomyces aquaticus]|uniref:pectin lyase n=1 Tax=Clohesyomyces aquaticus TaxID=1231657 RepID=A0A1Y1ZZ23_9PLEO|nr:pectin lyase fold/virulence factor [Clohesyomyces aquaticus]
MHFNPSLYVVLSLLASLGSVSAVGVVGQAPGFAADTTGGGNSSPVYPKDIKELTAYLTDNSPRVIVLNKEYNYIGSEGKVSEKGCRPDSNKCPGNGGQDAINGANWCSNSKYPLSISVSYDKAGIAGIPVKSNKSLIGIGSSGIIRGKGLRIANGAKNVIIQNIHITELNPQYIWGGDAITLVNTDLIWIDHVKTSLIGRQHIVTGYEPSNRVTISNSEIDGRTSWSATCDGHHYWAILFYGTSDKVTMLGNYIHNTSGRSPKVGGTGSGTLLHAVNNYWENNSGHAFDISENAKVLAEGNAFQNVKTTLLSGREALFSVPDTGSAEACRSALGRKCELNAFGSSGAFVGTATGFLGTMKDGVSPMAASKVVASVLANAGVGKI